jgi:hypothetical protein
VDQARRRQRRLLLSEGQLTARNDAQLVIDLWHEPVETVASAASQFRREIGPVQSVHEPSRVLPRRATWDRLDSGWNDVGIRRVSSCYHRHDRAHIR